MNLASSSKSQPDLVVELAEEFLERYRQGERPPLKDYIDRYPAYADEIREVFPALAVLENIALAEDHTPAAPGHASAPSKREPPAWQLGDFHILREIGHGGMGVVYEAEQVSLGRHVALKLLPAQLLRDPKQRRRFEREARAAARLHHANIVPVFGVGEHDGTPYYAMQFIPGHGLDEVLDEIQQLRAGDQAPALVTDHGMKGETDGKCGTAASVARSLWTGKFAFLADATEAASERHDSPPTAALDAGRATAPPPVPAISRALSPRDPGSSTESLFGASATSSLGGSAQTRAYWQGIARIGAQVADAVAYAHSQGILHRDIKPSNLLLDNHGTIWVTDFGLAKLDDQQNLTASGDILGTLRYMPPEGFEGRHDARGDVYSLGLTLYELLALRPAFDETDRARLIRLVTADAPVRLRKLDRDVPRDLETVIHKAIDREPDHRYQTAAEFAEDLRLFVEDRPVRARRASETEKFLRWCRRNPVPASLLGALILVFCLGFALVSWNWRAAVAERVAKEEQRLKANVASEEARAARDKAQIEEQKAKAAAVRALAEETKARDAAERASRSLYSSLIDRARLEQHAANIAESDAILDRCEPARRGWEWHFLKGLNHAELLTLRGHGPDAWVDSVAYSPDGTRMATAGGGDPYYGNPGRTVVPDTVIVWEAESGRPRYTLREAKHLVSEIAFSPDGRLLGYSSLDGSVYIHEAATGRLVQKILAGESEPSARGFQLRVAAQLLAFTPDGKSVGSNTIDQEYAIWDIATGTRRVLLRAVKHGYRRASFSADGRFVATLSGVSTAKGYGEIRLWNSATGTEVNLPEKNADHFCLAWSADGRTLAGGGSGFIALWNPSSGKLERVLTGHEGRVLAVAFRPDGERLASVGDDRTVRIWTTETGELRRVIRGHTNIVTCLAFSPDGDRLVTGSHDGTARVWDLTKDEETGCVDERDRGHTTGAIDAIASVRGGREALLFYRDARVVRLAAGSLDQLEEIVAGSEIPG